MPPIKPLSDSSSKWVRRASVSTPDYTAGVQNPRAPWAESTIAAGANYRTAVVAAANAGKFEAGVKFAGESKWQEGAIKKGPARYAEGVALSKDAYERGFAPFQAVISSLKLPPRGPAGSPQNLQRVAAVAAALRAAKEKK